MNHKDMKIAQTIKYITCRVKNSSSQYQYYYLFLILNLPFSKIDDLVNSIQITILILIATKYQ